MGYKCALPDIENVPFVETYLAKIFVLILVALLPVSSFAQVIEKSYLTTDKDIYAPKDTIWFKGYVFDMKNVLSTSSIAYHVLMVDADGAKQIDTSWPINGGVTDGYFLAPNTEGRFRIISVSGQMIGSHPDQLFGKDIFVRSDLADEIGILAFPQFEEFSPNQENLVDIFTQFSTNAIAPEVKLTYQILSGGERLKRGRLKTSEKGKVTLDLKGIKTLYSDLTLVIESEDKRLTKPVKLAVPIPVAQQQIDLQFFPEGGQLINGMINKVAFKAIDEKGNPFDFKGLLMNSKGEIIGSAESYYQGMGALKLIPQTDEEYFFRVNSPYKIDSLFKLPLAKKSGISLSLSDKQKDGKHYIIARASTELIDQKGKLIISNNSETISATEFRFSKQENWEVAYENLGVGAYSFLIINENGLPLAERLLFANSQEQLNVAVSTDKIQYNARGKVTTNITVTDAEGNPVQGNFSMAVIDKNRSKSPLEQPNLLTQVLLTSELKGHVPTPNFYFTSDPKSETALDLVMMTNGWRKYTPSNIENPESINGKMLRLNSERKPITNREIVISPLKTSGLEYFNTDINGRFHIPSAYLRNKGDSFLVFSNKLGKKDKFSLIEDEPKRVAKVKAMNSLFQPSQSRVTSDQMLYMKQNKIKPDIFQNTILLNSVTVESKRNSLFLSKGCELQEADFEDPWTTKMVSGLNMLDTDIIGLIKQVSGLVGGYGIHFEIRKNDPRQRRTIFYLDAIMSTIKIAPSVLSHGYMPFEIYINCNKIQIDEPSVSFNGLIPGDRNAKATLERIDFSNLESISVNRFYNLTDLRADITWPAINIRTKDGRIIVKPIFRDNIQVSAYSNYTKEFYSPVYATEKQKKDPVPDLRTTIFWQANVFTDENGRATITYYNADRPNQMEITVEGVDAFSRLGFGTTTYQVIEGPITEDKEQ